MFDNFNVNLRKNEGFQTYIPCIPIPEYGQSNAPLDSSFSTCEAYSKFIRQISVLLSGIEMSIISQGGRVG